jgi:hypothetical protein
MMFFGEVEAFCRENADEGMTPFVEPLAKGLGQLQQSTVWFMQNALGKPDHAGAGATEYMHLMGLVALGYMWARMARPRWSRRAKAMVSGPAWTRSSRRGASSWSA